MKAVITLFAIFCYCTSGLGQTYIGDQKEIDQILENIRQFSSYVVASDYDNISACYTEDGKIFPQRREIMEGQEEIRRYWVLPEGVRTVAHKITPAEIKIIGEEAYDYGHYEGTTRRANGEEVSWRGKYVIVWRKIEGNWKIYLDIWNSIDN